MHHEELKKFDKNLILFDKKPEREICKPIVKE